MNAKINQKSNAECLIDELQFNFLLGKKNLQYRVQNENNYILITGRSFFTSTVIDIIDSTADKFHYNFTGVGINLDGELEIQLDPR